jgi:uncharacterized cupredoxin-like copper-binding protein
VKRLATLASTLAVFLLTAALMAWMAVKVAEHPGVPREIGPLPPWFTGVPGTGSTIQARAAGVPAQLAAPSADAPAAARAAAPPAAYVDAAGGKVEIVLNEYEMKPSHVRVRSGTVTFVLQNEGRFAHNFHVEGPGVDVTAEKFGPGRTVRLEVALQEGEYKISCPLSNHDQRGMHGTLLATANLAGR